MNDNVIKYGLLVSIVGNAILLATVVGWLEFFLFLFLVSNCICVWYIRKLLKTIDGINSDMASMYSLFDMFADGLESIYGMEMFYGEPVVEDLIKRSHHVLNNLVEFQQKYSLDIVDVKDLQTVDLEEDYAAEEEN